MAELITLAVDSHSAITEQLDATQVPGAGDAQQRTLNHNGLGVSDAFDANTTVKPRKVMSLSITIDGTGNFDIDLTDAPLSVGRSEDLSAGPYRLIYFEFETPEANVSPVTIDCSQADPFPLFGAVSVDMILNPDERMTRLLQNNDGPQVAAGAKAIRISGDEDDVLNLKMVFGD